MEAETFRSRLCALILKSRKALRLYNNYGSNNYVSNTGIGNKVTNMQPFHQEGHQFSNQEFAKKQVDEWRAVNSLLLQRLIAAESQPQNRQSVIALAKARTEFETMQREAEKKLFSDQKDLCSAAERRDFIRAAILANELIVLKARVQAGQAAFHEIDALLRRSRVSVTHSEGIEAVDQPVIELERVSEESQVNVIPMRRRR